MAVSGSYSFSRENLIALQVSNILYNAGGIMPESMKKVSLGLKKYYIEVVGVNGLYSDGSLGAELVLKIDWKTHQFYLGSRGKEIAIPKNWVDGHSPQVGECINTFNEACQHANLSKEWFVMYQSIFDRDTINRELGFVSLPIRNWKYSPEEASFGLAPLDEVALTIKLGIR